MIRFVNGLPGRFYRIELVEGVIRVCMWIVGLPAGLSFMDVSVMRVMVGLDGVTLPMWEEVVRLRCGKGRQPQGGDRDSQSHGE